MCCSRRPKCAWDKEKPPNLWEYTISNNLLCLQYQSELMGDVCVLTTSAFGHSRASAASSVPAFTPV